MMNDTPIRVFFFGQGGKRGVLALLGLPTLPGRYKGVQAFRGTSFGA
jgi:hypothetical protein